MVEELQRRCSRGGRSWVEDEREEVRGGEREDGQRWGAERGGEDGDDGGAVVRRRRWRRRLEDGGVTMTVEKNPWLGQGVATVVAAAASR